MEQKITVPQLVKKFPAFSSRFITMFKTACDLPLS
jgi:hypothetical protein